MAMMIPPCVDYTISVPAAQMHTGKSGCQPVAAAVFSCYDKSIPREVRKKPYSRKKVYEKGDTAKAPRGAARRITFFMLRGVQPMEIPGAGSLGEMKEESSCSEMHCRKSIRSSPDRSPLL
ncbi:hypothetical protein [Selenomonas bovis]|uniref:hypothetical protein n=1 Tax=Selenomonas bovis TaxID=416586 RepID=UPI003D00E07F